jgi:hypothetical protein
MTTLKTKYYFLLIFFLTLLFIDCGQKDNKIKNITSVTKTFRVDTSMIAIIPFDKISSYIFDKNCKPYFLTHDDLLEIERLFQSCIDDYNKKLSPKDKNNFSIFGSNKRQYVAVINQKGEKEVWLNYLCETNGDSWKKGISIVKDGGSCYFHLKVNLTKKIYYDLSVNGVA